MCKYMHTPFDIHCSIDVAYEKSWASSSPNNKFVSFDPVRMMGSLLVSLIQVFPCTRPIMLDPTPRDIPRVHVYSGNSPLVSWKLV